MFRSQPTSCLCCPWCFGFIWSGRTVFEMFVSVRACEEEPVALPIAHASKQNTAPAGITPQRGPDLLCLRCVHTPV